MDNVTTHICREITSAIHLYSPDGSKCLYFRIIFCWVRPILFGDIRYRYITIPEVLIPHLASVSLSAATRLPIIHFCTSGGKLYSISIYLMIIKGYADKVRSRCAKHCCFSSVHLLIWTDKTILMILTFDFNCCIVIDGFNFRTTHTPELSLSSTYTFTLHNKIT